MEVPPSNKSAFEDRDKALGVCMCVSMEYEKGRARARLVHFQPPPGTRASSQLSPLECTGWWGECCSFFFHPSFSPSLFFFFKWQLFMSATASFWKGMTFVCVGICAHECVCPLSLHSPSSPPWLWHSTRQPPPSLPPNIEADSASQACTRHTWWLQQLERSLGHYGSSHYWKRRRGRDERRSSSDKKLIRQVIYALPLLLDGVYLWQALTSCVLSLPSLLFGCYQLLTAWFACESHSRKGEWNALFCSSTGTELNRGTPLFSPHSFSFFFLEERKT